MNIEIEQKVQAERDELAEKVSKLSGFLKSDRCKELPEYHQGLLRRQYYAMSEYLGILDERLFDLVN